MNNNGLNDQNNLNNQYDRINNQSVNNNINNFNNQYNNANNQNNLYTGNQVETPDNKNNKNNKKLLLIIVGVILIIFFVIKGFSGSSLSRGSKNTTGSTEYKDSDVDYNCTYEDTNDESTLKLYSDLIFNYKTTGDSGKTYNYQLKKYNKIIIEYKKELTDSLYKEYIDSLSSIDCIGTNKCTGDHLELSISALGYNTVIDRTGNKIIVTYYRIQGLNATATKDDIKDVMEQLKKGGYTCNY